MSVNKIIFQMGIYLCTYFQSEKFLNRVLNMLPNFTKKFWRDTDMKVEFSSQNDLIIDPQPSSDNKGYYQNEHSAPFQKFLLQKQGYKNVQKDILAEKEAYLAPIQYQLKIKVDLNPSNNNQGSVPESQIIQYISELTKYKMDKISKPHFQCIQTRSLQEQSKSGSTQFNHSFKNSTCLSKNRSKALEVNQNQEIFQISNIFTTNVSYKPLLYYGQPCKAQVYLNQWSTSDIHQMTEYNKKIGEAVKREVMYNRGFQCILAPLTIKRPFAL